MHHAKGAMSLMRTGFLLLILLSSSACDYWPPALQEQIEGLRAELHNALDDRQRSEEELIELRRVQTALQEEIDAKARENANLHARMTALSSQPARTVSTSPTPPAHSRKTAAMPSSIRKGRFVSLQLEYPHMRGMQVERVQRLLQRHEVPIRADGVFGNTTEAAVRSFQRVHGLPATGIVGPRTYRALHTPPPSARQTRALRLQYPAITGQDVTRIQKALRRAGYRIPVDGHFGPDTEVAVRRFQRKHGLHPDGMVGPRTLAVLTQRR